MPTPDEMFDKIISMIHIDFKDNTDNTMMGDTRGKTLWRVDNREELKTEFLKLLLHIQPGFDKTIERMKAAEAFINIEGTYNATWERKFEAFSKWNELRK